MLSGSSRKTLRKSMKYKKGHFYENLTKTLQHTFHEISRLSVNSRRIVGDFQLK